MIISKKKYNELLSYKEETQLWRRRYLNAIVKMNPDYKIRVMSKLHVSLVYGSHDYEQYVSMFTVNEKNYLGLERELMLNEDEFNKVKGKQK